jgi:crotonobetainyl-CoA:carnitine CoA-transferase CaiB-like acyl-CoA transferase
MELIRVLDDMASAIENARAMPMSSSCVVNRPQLLALIQEAENLIPKEMRQASRLLEVQDQVLQEARVEAEELLTQARAERERLLSVHEIYLAAVRAANEVREEAETEARRMRDEVDDYVDSKLANFEVALTRTLDAVTAGRDKIRARSESSAMDGPGAAMHGQLLDSP